MNQTRTLGWLLILLAAQSDLTTAQTVEVSFPDDHAAWPKASPEKYGWSSDMLELSRDQMCDDQGRPFELMDAIVIVDGHDIFHYGEAYDLRTGLRTQHDWASCGRSLMTAMYGMAFKEFGENLDALEQPAHSHLDTYHSRSMDKRILVKHMLGYAIDGVPGTEWRYHSSYFDCYKCLRDIDGVPLRHRLSKLANAIGANWEPFEYWGHEQNVPFLTIKSTAADAARWGYLWLNRGRWKDSQIIDADFVDRSVLPLRRPDNSGWLHNGEGLQIHLNFGGMWGETVPRDAYAAFGAGGRVIVVIPSMKLVFAASMSPPPYQKKVRNGLQVRDINALMTPLIAAAPTPKVTPSSSTGWISLFDGESLSGWTASENKDSFGVKDGCIVAKGDRSHLFYTGDIQNGNFKDFELWVELKTMPSANSGIYIHSKYQEEGWPLQGHQIQINQTDEADSKTGGLHGVADVLEASPVQDHQWYSQHISVLGDRVILRVNDVVTTDYIEPTNPIRENPDLKGRVLGEGTFALQAHDPESEVHFRQIWVKPLD
ncbi:MAG: DUF1080 domain-containing protein [Planctomycetota bacterium]